MPSPDIIDLSTSSDVRFRDVYGRHQHQAVPTSGNLIQKVFYHVDGAQANVTAAEVISLDSGNNAQFDLLMRGAAAPLTLANITAANIASWSNASILSVRQGTTAIRSANVVVNNLATASLNVAPGVLNKLDNFVVQSFQKTLNSTAGAATEICTITQSHGLYTATLDVIQSSSTNTNISRSYTFISRYNGTSNAWRRLLPLASTTDNATQWGLEIRTNNDVTTLRLVRLNGTVSSGFECVLKISQSRLHPVSIADASTTSSDVVYATTAYENSLISQVGGFVGIGTDRPTQPLTVSGDTLVSGNLVVGGLSGDTLVSGNLVVGGLKDVFADHNYVWTSRISAADLTWRGIAYGNGVFVAVANSGSGNRVMTSPDGITWTIRQSVNDNQWVGVGYGNALFVVVSLTGTNDRIMTSPDGITWTSRTSPANLLWRSVVWGNDRFVAVASNGTGADRVMTSTDGITWTLQTAAAALSWQSVTFGDGLFVAVASDGVGNRVMTSPDGITWDSRQSAADNSWNSVTWGNGLFAAVSSTGAGNRVMTSPDGITWTSRQSAADNSWFGVAYGYGYFVAVSNSGSGNRAMISTDGITWTIMSTGPTNRNWRAVAYGDGIFAAVSESGSGDRVMTWYLPTSHVMYHNPDTGFLSRGPMDVYSARVGSLRVVDDADVEGTLHVTGNVSAGNVTVAANGNFGNVTTEGSLLAARATITGNTTLSSNVIMDGPPHSSVVIPNANVMMSGPRVVFGNAAVSTDVRLWGDLDASTGSAEFGTITSGPANVNNAIFRSFQKSLPVTGGTLFATISSPGGACTVELNMVQTTDANNAIAKTYKFPVYFNATNGQWRTLLPLTSSGQTSAGNDVGILARVTGNTSTSTYTTELLVARLLGGTNPNQSNVSVNMIVHQNPAFPVTITESGFFGDPATTLSGAPFAPYDGTLIHQNAYNGCVGINTDDPSPAYILHVEGKAYLKNVISENVLTTMATSINGVNIVSGSGNVQIDGGTVLTKTQLGSTVTSSSLTSVGTLGSLAVSGNVTAGNLHSPGVVNASSAYRIGNTDVLTSSALGSGVTASSLTSVGTLGSLSVTGNVSAGNVSGTTLSGSTLSVTGNNHIFDDKAFITVTRTISSNVVNAGVRVGSIGTGTANGGKNSIYVEILVNQTVNGNNVVSKAYAVPFSSWYNAGQVKRLIPITSTYLGLNDIGMDAENIGDGLNLRLVRVKVDPNTVDTTSPIQVSMTIHFHKASGWTFANGWIPLDTEYTSTLNPSAITDYFPGTTLMQTPYSLAVNTDDLVPGVSFDVNGVSSLRGAVFMNGGYVQLDNVIMRSFQKSLGATTNDASEICTITQTASVYTAELNIVQSSSQYTSPSRLYKYSVHYNATGNAWHQLLPLSSYTSITDSYRVDIRVDNAVTTLRLVRVGATFVSGNNVTSSLTGNIECTLIVSQSRTHPVTIADSAVTANSVAAVTTTYLGTALCQVGGNVGIGTASPSARLDVSGTLNVTGNVTADNVITTSASVSGLASGFQLRSIGNFGPGTSPSLQQGGYMTWNHTNGIGEIDLICKSGTGSGGVHFYQGSGSGNTTTINDSTLIARILPSGIYTKGIFSGPASIIGSLFATGRDTDINEGITISPSSLTKATYGNNWTTVATFTYTPKSTNSRLCINWHHYYLISGSNADNVRARITLDNVEISYREQVWNSSTQGGGGTRSGTIFPQAAVYKNTTTSQKTIRIQINMGLGGTLNDDTLTISPTDWSLDLMERQT